MRSVGDSIIYYELDGKNASEHYGKKIKSAIMTEKTLSLTLDDDKTIYVWDDGQDCCEHRYMTTDDDVQSLVGNILIRIEAKDAACSAERWDVHEQVFVEIGTDKGFITIVNHNEHNGFYGGFSLTVTEQAPAFRLH